MKKLSLELVEQKVYDYLKDKETFDAYKFFNKRKHLTPLILYSNLNPLRNLN